MFTEDGAAAQLPARLPLKPKSLAGNQTLRNAVPRVSDSLSFPALPIGPGTIGVRQTTHWELAFEQGPRLRLHFIDKAETRFATTRFQAATILEDHPLLVEYRAPWCALSFRGRPHDIDAAVTALRGVVSAMAQGWRHADNYVNRSFRLPELLAMGSGSLWEGPEAYGMAVAAELQRAGVEVQAHSLAHPSSLRRVVVLDQSYVVATGFRVELLRSE